jgi:hypothetical protein
MEIIVAIALICSEKTCDNMVHSPRFYNIDACNAYLWDERLRQSRQGNMVVLDDCIITTEERIKAYK